MNDVATYIALFLEVGRIAAAYSTWVPGRVAIAGTMNK